MASPLTIFLRETLYAAVLTGSLRDMVDTVEAGAREYDVRQDIILNSGIGAMENYPLPIVAFKSNRDTYEKLDYLIRQGVTLVFPNPDDGKTLLDYAEANPKLQAFLEKRGYAFGTARGHGKVREKFEFQGFTVLNAGLGEDQMADVLPLLKKAIARIRQLGFGEILYGPMVIVSSMADGAVFDKMSNQYKNVNQAAYYDYNKDIIVIKADSFHGSFAAMLFAHELAHRHWFKFLSPSQRQMWLGKFEERGFSIKPGHATLLADILKASAPKMRDSLGFEYWDWSNFDWNKCLRLLRAKQVKYRLMEVLDAVVDKWDKSGGNIKSRRRKFIEGMFEKEAFGGMEWCAKWIDILSKYVVGAATKEDVRVPARYYDDPKDAYEFCKKHVNKPPYRLEDLVKRTQMVKPPLSTTEYGQNNEQEDYAEAFSYYIMNKPMPEELVFLFRKINGIKVARENDNLTQNQQVRVDWHSVASELVKTARLLVADSYPVAISDRGKQALDILREGLERQQIYNAHYKDASDSLSRAFERAATEMGKALWQKHGESISKLLYLAIDSLLSFQSLNKHIKIWKAWTNNPSLPQSWDLYRERFPELPAEVTPELIAGVKEWVAFLESWQEAAVVRQEVKKYIVKGRAPDPNKPKQEQYAPPPQSVISLSRIKKMLEDLMAEKKAEFIRNVQEVYMRVARTYAEKNEGKSLRKYFKGSDLEGLVRRMVEAVRPDGSITDNLFEMEKPENGITIRLSPGAKSIAEKSATQTVEFVAEKFVYKNMRKLTSIVGEKERAGHTLIGAKEGATQISGLSFSGYLHFTFSDQSSFSVNNQAVYVVNQFGTAFTRYPTTFHNVVFPDGKKKPMLSEKQMNQEWVTA